MGVALVVSYYTTHFSDNCHVTVYQRKFLLRCLLLLTEFRIYRALLVGYHYNLKDVKTIHIYLPYANIYMPYASELLWLRVMYNHIFMKICDLQLWPQLYLPTPLLVNAINCSQVLWSSLTFYNFLA